MPMLKYTLTIAVSLILPLSSLGQSPETPPEATIIKAVEKSDPAAKAEEAKASPASADTKELERLTLANSLAAEKHKDETNQIKEEIAKLKLEKELFAEKLASASLKKSAKHMEELVEHEAQKEKLTREATVAKLELEM